MNFGSHILQLDLFGVKGNGGLFCSKVYVSFFDSGQFFDVSLDIKSTIGTCHSDNRDDYVFLRHRFFFQSAAG